MSGAERARMNRQTERPWMSRRLLGSMMALRAVVTLIGGAGIFAVFTDRAKTGSSSVTSGKGPARRTC